MKLATLVLGACALASTGCAAYIDNRYGPEKIPTFAIDKSEAIVIFSAGAPDPCISKATFLKLLPLEIAQSQQPLALASVDAWAVKSDFPDHHGNVHVIRVAPGSYHFVPEKMALVVPLKLPSARFSVEPGEVAYLGQYFLKVQCSLHDLVVLSDEMDRDLTMVRRKNPALDTSVVHKKIFTFAPAPLDEKPAAAPRSSFVEGPPPDAIAGFTLGEDVAAAEARCTGKGFTWSKLDARESACSGAPESVGLPVTVKLTACDGTVCAVILNGNADKAPWSVIAPRYAALARLLDERHGDHGEHYNNPLDDCTQGFAACFSAGRARASTTWKWADKQGLVSLVLDGGPPGGAPSLRVIYGGAAYLGGKP